MSVNCFLFVSFWFLRNAFFTVPGIRMCCPGGSEGDSRSFFPGRRSSLEGCTAATSSQSCWKCYCRTVHLQREEKDRIIVSSTSDILKSPRESETKNLCVSEGRSVLTLCSGVVLSGVESKVQLTLEHLSVVSVNQLINTLVDHVGLMTDGRSSHLPEWQFKYLNTFVFRVCSHRFTWWKPRKSWMVGDA